MAMQLWDFLKLFIPRNDRFYPIFEKAAINLVDISEIFYNLLLEKNQEKRQSFFKQIKAHETAGDQLVQQVMDELNTTFVTPFDREDIQRLATSLDGIVDHINNASQKIQLYKPKSYSPQFLAFARLLIDCAKNIHTAMHEMHNFNKPETIKLACKQLSSIEKQADELYHEVLSDLFESESDAIELIKKKEIVQSLEKATDKAEDVANVLKTILVKSV